MENNYEYIGTEALESLYMVLTIWLNRHPEDESAWQKAYLVGEELKRREVLCE